VGARILRAAGGCLSVLNAPLAVVQEAIPQTSRQGEAAPNGMDEASKGGRHPFPRGEEEAMFIRRHASRT
jgi:hypothetical protein